MTLEAAIAVARTLTEGCGPGPWYAYDIRHEDYGWWLENAAGDSSYPSPEDVAAMVNGLLALDAAPMGALVRLRSRVPGVEPYRWLPDGSPCYCQTQEPTLHPGWQHSLLCRRQAEDYAAVEEFAAALRTALEPEEPRA
jgi:hypothetical protein